MIACVQKVSFVEVTVGDELVNRTGAGLIAYLGVEKGDSLGTVSKMAEKIYKLRIFRDERGKMAKSVQDTNGSVMVISQFTLAADMSKGNRPGFESAADPDIAEELYESLVITLKSVLGDERVKSGRFGAYMNVALINDGPVTILLKK